MGRPSVLDGAGGGPKRRPYSKRLSARTHQEDLLAELGIVHFDQGKYDPAVDAFQRLVKNTPTQVSASYGTISRE
jgi:Flp pilus assembly protein TadD